MIHKNGTNNAHAHAQPEHDCCTEYYQRANNVRRSLSSQSHSYWLFQSSQKSSKHSDRWDVFKLNKQATVSATLSFNYWKTQLDKIIPTNIYHVTKCKTRRRKWKFMNDNNNWVPYDRAEIDCHRADLYRTQAHSAHFNHFRDGMGCITYHTIYSVFRYQATMRICSCSRTCRCLCGALTVLFYRIYRIYIYLVLWYCQCGSSTFCMWCVCCCLNGASNWLFGKLFRLKCMNDLPGYNNHNNNVYDNNDNNKTWSIRVIL